MEERVWSAALAGLLHDIGKVAQRARTDPWNPAPGSENAGQPVHATWSEYFIQNNVPAPYRAAALHGAYHHAPERSPAADKRLSTLVTLADNLSAGERSDLPANYPGKRPPQQMVTIFDRLALAGKPRGEDFHFLPLAELELTKEALFPAPGQSQAAQGDAYERMRAKLEQAARFDPGDPETYLENLLATVQRLTWCVPSAYYHSLPDVSLYDHSRMTAALAVCLSELDEGDIQNRLDALRREFQGEAAPTDRTVLDRPAALLVGGDISGVQEFIYTLSSKGAAKTLRGRSFYLQLLTEAVLRYALRALGLPYTNVIYAGGGHFYLLAPPGAKALLAELRRSITATLLDHHGASLYLALDYAAVPTGGFKLGRFTQYWSDMHDRLGRAKQRRYTELGDELYARVFEPQAHGGNRENTCAVCGEERASTVAWDEESRICSLCRSMHEEIGQRLPQAEFVALGFHDPRPAEPGTALSVLRAFGTTVRFARDAKDALTFAEKPERAVIWALDTPQGDRWPGMDGVPAAHVLRFTVNQVPPMSFDKLQQEAHGIRRLGVLRMDVDNLGDLFSQGFGLKEDSRASIARISTLSFQLSVFFEGWVKQLCEAQGGLIYAVYAGGDDVFLIGPWDRMPDLARAIAHDLRQYAGENPDVHLSGGLAFIHGKYPVYQAAEDAQGAVNAAKHLEGKDAFSFLGRAWKWTDFDRLAGKFERARRIVSKPEAAERGLDGPQQMLQVLQQLAEDEADAAKRLNGRPVWGPWMWHGAYQLTRMAEREKKRSAPLHSELMAIRDELSQDNYREIGQWGTAARWAQLWLREAQEG